MACRQLDVNGVIKARFPHKMRIEQVVTREYFGRTIERKA
jgi:hypothetical protein